MPKHKTVQQVHQQLYLVTLPLPRPGFANFITSWIYTAGPVVVVDVGPSSSASHLIDALSELGIQPDLILLTHIHLDHAGAIGTLSKCFPQAPVVCHPKAVNHLNDPQRLWEGSLKTLGEVAEQYGPMTPVDKDLIIPADQQFAAQITAIPTPGHAPHQYGYLIDDLLFAGETGGVCITLSNDQYYLRPATPPPLHLKTYLDSIELLINHNPQHICYGHVGLRNDADAMLQRHRKQLLAWREWIRPWFEGNPTPTDEIVNACLADLLRKDPLLSTFVQLSADDQERERFFLKNSIRGYWGYLADMDHSER